MASGEFCNSSKSWKILQEPQGAGGHGLRRKKDSMEEVTVGSRATRT